MGLGGGKSREIDPAEIYQRYIRGALGELPGWSEKRKGKKRRRREEEKRRREEDKKRRREEERREEERREKEKKRKREEVSVYSKTPDQPALPALC